MTTSNDPFDRTLGAWLETLERDAPAGVTSRVADRARASSQRPGWLARAELGAGLAPLPGMPGATARAIALVALLAAGLLFVAVIGSGTRPAPPRVIPSAPPSTVAGPSAAVERPAVAAGGRWEPVAPPAVSPSGLVGLRLDDGRVLVLGDAATVFDPATGRWMTISQPRVARSSPAVALLLDGRVLVTGGTRLGEPGGTPLATAELYDPATDRWTGTGSMSQARASGHTATTLPDGRVLVAAGTEFAGLQSAELFDPSTGAWTSTTPLHEARSDHTATLLADGRVLVAGGLIYHEVAIASAEIYDPVEGTWTVVDPMSAERIGHASTLLDDGTVLVTGGHLGLASSGPQAAGERLDPLGGVWHAAGSMETGRYHHSATLLPDGRVLVAGGLAGSSATAASEVYDPNDGTWLPAPEMGRARQGQVAVALPDGSLLVVGGDQAGRRASAERYVGPASP